MTGCAGTTRKHATRRPGTPPRAGAAPRPALVALCLPAAPASAAAARRRARAALTRQGLDAIADAAISVLSELVANAVTAVRAAPGQSRPIRLRITALDGGTGARLEVWDAGPGHPQLAQPGTDDTSGRGLLIVAALSASWGYQTGPSGGKSTWAEITP